MKRYLPALRPADRRHRVFGAVHVGRWMQFVEYDWESVDMNRDPLIAVLEEEEKLHIGRQCDRITEILEYIRDSHLKSVRQRKSKSS